MVAITRKQALATLLAAPLAGTQAVPRAQAQEGPPASDLLLATLWVQRSVEFKLPIESITETVEVVGLSSLIDSSRAGTADNVSTKAIETLPTISRNIVDIARSSPYFNPAGLNEDPLALSVAPLS